MYICNNNGRINNSNNTFTQAPSVFKVYLYALSHWVDRYFIFTFKYSVYYTSSLFSRNRDEC